MTHTLSLHVAAELSRFMHYCSRSLPILTNRYLPLRALARIADVSAEHLGSAVPDSRTCSVNGSPSDTHPAPTPKLGHQPRGGEEGSRSGLLLPHLSECHDNLENVIKPTWAYANEVRDCQIYRKLITELLGKQRQLWSKRLESILMQIMKRYSSLPVKPSSAVIINN